MNTPLAAATGLLMLSRVWHLLPVLAGRMDRHIMVPLNALMEICGSHRVYFRLSVSLD